MPTEQQVVAAVLTAVNAALPASVRAYEPSKVPTARPSEYVVVTVARRFGGEPRVGRYDVRGWTLYLMAASRTSEANARNTVDRFGAIEGEQLTVAGTESTPITFRNSRPVAPDDGWFSGATTFDLAF